MSELDPTRGPERVGGVLTLDEIQDLLGEPLQCPAVVDPTLYDERVQIAQNVQNAANGLRDKMMTVAGSMGITVTGQQYADWRPNHVEAVGLRQELRRERKMAVMTRGVGAYLEDQAETARALGVPLRSHQRDVVEDFGDFVLHARRTTEFGGKSGYIEMPTGTGKTAVFANIVSALKHDENPENPVRVLVLVPTQTILDQTMGRSGERGFGKFAPHLKISAYYEGEHDLSGEVVVMCNASFNRLMEQGDLPDFDAVVVDEAHMVRGETTGANVGEYCKDKLSIGLTATPEYDEDRTIYDLFEHEIHQMDLATAIRGGLLAPVRAWLHDVKVTVDPQTLPENEAERKIALRRARLEAHKHAATEIIKKELERGVSVVVRCPAGDDIEVARTYATELRDTLVRTDDVPAGMRWINAAFVGGSKQSKGLRREILAASDQGMFDVVTYVQAIEMGWDSNAKVYINLDGTESRVRTVQPLGRTLRLSRGPDGKPVEAHAHEFVDPELGDKQYTVLHALNLKSGQAITHEAEVQDVPIPPPRKRMKERLRGEVTDSVMTTIGVAVLLHTEEAQFPTQDEVNTTVNLLSPERPVDMGEACRILGISVPTYKQILLGLGVNPANPIRYADLTSLVELYPALRAEPLPQGDERYVDALGFAHDNGVRGFLLMRFARSEGVHPRRFTGEDGKVRFYLPADEAQDILTRFKAQN